MEVLDGDEVRPHLSAGLGFTREDRDTNVPRIGFVARLLASHGVIVLVPVIAPYADAREAVRDDHDAARRCRSPRSSSPPRSRSPSTRRQGPVRQGTPRARSAGMTGVDDPYESPRRAELGSTPPADRATLPRRRAAEREGTAARRLATRRTSDGHDPTRPVRAAPLSELQALESEAIHIFREVAASSSRR